MTSSPAHRARTVNINTGADGFEAMRAICKRIPFKRQVNGYNPGIWAEFKRQNSEV
jgi:hypothetical protein